MIIGYYEQSFFGGGTYIKLSRKDEEAYRLESISSGTPNYIPDAEKYIKKYESIKCSEKFKKIFGEEPLLFTSKMNENVELLNFIEYIKTIDFKILSEKRYYNDGILDGMNWEIFIEFQKEKWHIHGYEDMPKEVEKIIKVLLTTREYCNNSEISLKFN